MEITIDISEESEKTQNLVDFLTKVTIQKIAEHKFVIKFEGNLAKFRLQVQDVIGFLLWHWYFSTEEHKQLENQKQAKKESYTV